jgi:hypothetical protein
LIEPNDKLFLKHPFVEIMRLKEQYTLENQKLGELKDLLLAKMTKVEIVKELA